jgi:hypothetical protein
MLRKAGFRDPTLLLGDGLARMALFSLSLARGLTVIKKVGLALALLTMASLASAKGPDSAQCVHILWFDFCPPTNNHDPQPVKAPEIDPSSAMAGLTLMLGGLAVLRGRRAKISKE